MLLWGEVMMDLALCTVELNGTMQVLGLSVTMSVEALELQHKSMEEEEIF